MAVLTAGELARSARISESTLYSYLRREGSRIPTIGRGRERRFPESAVPVVRQIRRENLQRKRKHLPGYLTLKDISRITGISQTTLRRYQETHGRDIPSRGEARRRVYPREAVALFRRLRRKSRRGPTPSSRQATPQRQDWAPLERRLKLIEKQLQRNSDVLEQLLREIRKPLRFTVNASRKGKRGPARG